MELRLERLFLVSFRSGLEDLCLFMHLMRLEHSRLLGTSGFHPHELYLRTLVTQTQHGVLAACAPWRLNRNYQLV